MKNQKRTTILAKAVGMTALGLISLSGFQASANLITNGSFETGSFVDNTGQDTMKLNPGSTAINGWTVTTASLAWIGASNPFGLSASQGSYFLDLSGYHDNAPYGGVAASTAITTVIGQQYQVMFDLGSDHQYNSQSPSVEVMVSGSPANATFTAGPVAAANNRWETFAFIFTATATSTSIEFDGTGANNQAYVGLDNVSVEAIVPEASSIIAGTLLLLPFGAGAIRSLRKNAVA